MLKLTASFAAPQIQSRMLGILFTAFLGAGIVFLAGHAQSETLHSATHDVRHATGFPCH